MARSALGRRGSRVKVLGPSLGRGKSNPNGSWTFIPRCRLDRSHSLPAFRENARCMCREVSMRVVGCWVESNPERSDYKREFRDLCLEGEEMWCLVCVHCTKST